MAKRKYTNNADSSLAVGIASGDISCTITAGTGTLFPVLAAGEVFRATITDAATRSLREIVLVTARTTDTMTITRAQDGTAARAFLAGDKFELLITADLGNNAAYVDYDNAFSVPQSVPAPTTGAHAARWDSPTMPTISATATAGALAVSAVSFPLTYRSTTLGSGAVSEIIAAPVAATLPSGSTLGFVSGTQGTLIVAEMNNGGVAEFAFCNKDGGLPLNEKDLITTTAIGVGSTAANVWYSTTPRTNLPYKIVGEIELINTAGSWGSPSLVQPIGGLATVRSATSLRVNTAAGTGTTNTAIRRIETTAGLNIGNDVTLTHSATLGTSATINRSGMYTVVYTDEFNGATAFGISLNSTQLTTSIASITAADRIAIAISPAANSVVQVCASQYFRKGDVIRPHVGPGATSGTAPDRTQFTITGPF